jgi:hypothetical protein
MLFCTITQSKTGAMQKKKFIYITVCVFFQFIASTIITMENKNYQKGRGYGSYRGRQPAVRGRGGDRECTIQQRNNANSSQHQYQMAQKTEFEHKEQPECISHNVTDNPSNLAILLAIGDLQQTLYKHISQTKHELNLIREEQKNMKRDRNNSDVILTVIDNKCSTIMKTLHHDYQMELQNKIDENPAYSMVSSLLDQEEIAWNQKQNNIKDIFNNTKLDEKK